MPKSHQNRDLHGPRILSFLAEYQRIHFRAPTYREIGDAVGLRSTDHVRRDLKKLEQEGHISFQPHRSRSIVIANVPMPLPPPPTPPAPQIPPRLRGHCQRCEIKCRGLLCEDCKTGAPFIQTHLLMGEERFHLGAMERGGRKL